MIYKEKRYGYETCYLRKFDNITDLKRFIDNTEPTEVFKRTMLFSIKNKYDFTGTHSYEEAMNLLLHGWDYMAGKLTNSLKTVNTGVRQRNKNVYSVAGYQACVPRYLQGMPDSMIYSKRVPAKDKVITINKSINYASRVKTEQIFNESIKVLQLVRMLESKGYKVNINILLGSGNATEGVSTFAKLKIKTASSRLNIKQVAFPLIHPSMIRRIMFSLIERVDECNKRCFAYSYGRPINEHICFKDIMKGEYFIPAIVSEEEITDIEKYYIK